MVLRPRRAGAACDGCTTRLGLPCAPCRPTSPTTSGSPTCWPTTPTPLSQARFKALDLHVMTKPDLTPVTDADQSVEEGIRRMLSRARSRDAVHRRGDRAPPGTASDAGWSTRSTAPRTSCAAYPCGPRLISLMVDDEVVVGVVSAPDAEPALVGDEGRRRLDRQVAAARHAPARSPTSPASRTPRCPTPRCPAGTSAAGSTTSCRCPGAAGAPGRTATSGPTCSSPRGPSTSPPSPSSSSTTWPRST